MGSWAELRVGGQDLFHWKSEVEPTFLFLFTKEEVVYRPLEDPDDDPFANPTLLLVSTVQVLRDRLDALGVSGDGLVGCFEYVVSQEVEALVEIAAAPWGHKDSKATVKELRAMTFVSWVDRVRDALPTYSPVENDDGDYSKLGPLMHLWEDLDPRWLLRALLEACPPEDEVRLDLTDLELSGYLEAYDFDPQIAATVMFSIALLNGSPAVVITEGTTDAEFLKAAIEIRRPHLVNYIRFYEFGGAVAGGASLALNTVKAFAAAGISNRVIVLLDNDSAAREARRSMRGIHLPSHYAVDHYPEIKLGEAYPSVGPTGEHSVDINGLAGSIELYLGADSLTDPTTGSLRPVVWKSHISAIDAWQGEVADKGKVQAAFREMVTEARENPAVTQLQDWSGMDAVLEKLMHLLRTVGVSDPADRRGFVR